MKYIAMLSVLLMSQALFAAGVKWSSQEVESSYVTTKSIQLSYDDRVYTIPENTEFKLIEESALGMIKVHLHKYKIKNCPGRRIETDLELIQVAQDDGMKTSVGVNLAKGCILEVLVDLKEYNTNSFLLSAK